MSGVLRADAIRPHAGLARLGRSIDCVAEIDSTNAEALRRLERVGAAMDGWVLLAESQSAGRGRLGRTWQSPRGSSVLMTAVVCGPADLAWRLVLAGGLAVCAAVGDVAEVDARMRWPNDVFVRGRKLAGVLVESRSLAGGAWGFAVGIGVNCLQQSGHFPPDLRDRATSLEIECPRPVDRAALAAALLARLDEFVIIAAGGDAGELIRRWHDRSDDIGRTITLVHAGRTFAGTVVEVDADLGLWVELAGGGRTRFDPRTTARSS